MPAKNLLVKLRQPGADGMGLAVGGKPGRLSRLFDAPAPSDAGQGMAAAEGGTWFALTPEAAPFAAGSAHPWDVAHAAWQDGMGLDRTTVVAVEPDMEQSWLLPAASTGEQALAATLDCTAAKPEMPGPKYRPGGHFAWHLDDDYSQLRSARVAAGGGHGVTVVHLDTGYDPGHTGLPTGLDRTAERNFRGDEDGSSAVDRAPAGPLTNRGHGTGTIGILAGGTVSGLPGPIGGAPKARVVPVRVANSVVQFSTGAVAQGIDYARLIGADVVSMSLGGVPSLAWADAVNAAYEAGVLLVCAAGNSFRGLPTSLIVYPARFGRVLAACGVMAKGRDGKEQPYYGLDGPMEGCIGPGSKMATAMAAFTPNIPWLRLGCPGIVDMDGNGTSAATPQLAAAAALWLAANGPRFPGRDWRRVEAVRAGLFHPQGEPDHYYGMGILKARDALDRVPDAASLRRTDPDSAALGFLKLLTGAFGISPASDERQLDMFRLELTQLALASRGFQEAVPEPHAPAKDIPDAAKRAAFTAILDEGVCSLALRGFLGSLLGRTVGGWAAPRGPMMRAAPGAATPDPNRVPRQIAIPAPTRRRLRIFATDPSGSAQLDTAFINVATVEVPWEDVQPGPVGEYLEVIDVDPASGAAYPPVDLSDRHLLAQDGYAPSEGNPQFHQQAVYAVAMRTIRNFEIALGRRVLWAERRGHRAADGSWHPAPDNGYVRRLRIYPHALRQRNAFYSPDRKALLFGYFGDVSGPSRGRQVVFTCLSHDIVAHETTHALLDGLHRRFQDDTNPDVLAFHEAFADIVAIFQHFTFPELLRHELARLRGDLTRASILSDLARQFGQSLHNTRALREAIGPHKDKDGKDAKEEPPDPTEKPRPLQNYRDTAEPHDRGAILVAAMFEAFVAIYTRRTQGLIRLATAGSGVLAPGALHPDLVDGLANAAVEVAQRILTTAIRALDYMPPIDPSFGDYLRAVVTADADQEPDHGLGYRVAFAEAFARRGIYPDDVPSVSPDGLLWQASDGPVQSTRLDDFLRTLDLASYTHTDRRKAFDSAKRNAELLHGWLMENLDADMARSLGLDFTVPPGRSTPLFEVHSVRPALRTTADGERRTDIVAVITQSRELDPAPGAPAGSAGRIYGGCTLLLDRSHGPPPIRYAIIRPIDAKRIDALQAYRGGAADARGLAYGDGGAATRAEPFAALHAALAME